MLTDIARRGDQMAKNFVRRIIFAQTLGDRIPPEEIRAHINDWSWMAAHYRQRPPPPHASPEQEWGRQIGDVERNWDGGSFYSSPKTAEEITRIVDAYSVLATNGNRLALARIAAMAERGQPQAWDALARLARNPASAEYGFMALRQMAVEGSQAAVELLTCLHGECLTGATYSLAWARERGVEGIRNLEQAAELYFSINRICPRAHANLLGMAALGVPRAKARIAQIMRENGRNKVGSATYTAYATLSSAGEGDRIGRESIPDALGLRDRPPAG